MTKMSDSHDYPFLSGGGEMGEYIRTFNWSQTVIGTPDSWPQSLKTAVSMLLGSCFPMCLFWGEAPLCFYNDAFCPGLGDNGWQGGCLGQWDEKYWPGMNTLIHEVTETGKGIQAVDQLLPVCRNGEPVDFYGTYSCSPVRDEAGKTGGVLFVCLETTTRVKALKQVTEQENQLRFATEAAELGTWDLNPRTGKFTGNSRLKDWFGLLPEEAVPLTLAIDVIQESDRERVAAAIEQAMQYRSGGNYDIEYTIIHPVTGQPRIVRAKGRAWFNEDHSPYRFNGTLQDITSEVTARQKLENSELQFRSLIECSPVRTVLITGKEQIITLANEPVLQSWGVDKSALGKSLVDILPEMADQDFPALLAEVYNSGQPYHAADKPVTWIRNGEKEIHYFDFTYQPMYNTQGLIYGVLSTAIDVTEKVLARQKLEERDLYIHNIVDNTDAAIIVYEGYDMTCKLANERMLYIFGRDAAQMIGKPLAEAVPELIHTPILEKYRDIMSTGESFYQPEEHFTLLRYGKPHSGYYSYTYKALNDADGIPYGVLCTCIEITSQVNSRKEIEATEARMRSTAERLQLALDAGNLGSYELNTESGEIDCTIQCKKSYGLTEEQELTFEFLLSLLLPEDRDELRSAVAGALETHTSYSAEYRIRRGDDHNIRWIRTAGTPVYDKNGTTVKIVGITLDITAEKTFTEELSRRVQEKTEELAVINEELKATNEDLFEANEQLIHSNEELSQYAYVASHDLQEPLRKIRIFSGMLDKQVILPEHQKAWVDKIRQSSGRMSDLIRDLLDFSRLLKSDTLMAPVDLSAVMHAVITDFELMIADKEARITIDTLPVIDAIGLQMNQLFYNLISNSLKFTATGRRPVIRITAAPVETEEIKAYIHKPLPAVRYFRIAFADNGIGFEPEYTEQIFEVFKRLHSREIYPGSGVGLALCRRIAGNHNGYLYVTSALGEGTTFYIILPEKQHAAG